MVYSQSLESVVHEDQSASPTSSSTAGGADAKKPIDDCHTQNTSAEFDEWLMQKFRHEMVIKRTMTRTGDDSTNMQNNHVFMSLPSQPKKSIHITKV
jgi:hypothetical protein